MATAYRRKHSKRRRKHRRYGNPALSIGSFKASAKHQIKELPTAAIMATGLALNKIAVAAIASRASFAAGDGIGSYLTEFGTAVAQGFIPKYGKRMAGGAVLGLTLRAARQFLPGVKNIGSLISGLVDSATGQTDNPLPGYGELIDDRRFNSRGRFGDLIDDAEFNAAAEFEA